MERADRNLALPALDQMDDLYLRFEIACDPVNQNRRIIVHCRALPFWIEVATGSMWGRWIAVATARK
jgi:hypothetical protein